MSNIILSFYKYTPIDDPQRLKNYLKVLCDNHHILGRILIAKEGINGAVCARKQDIDEFKQALLRDELFSDLTFREQDNETNAYHKLVIKIRPEIVHFGDPTDMSNRGTPLPPETLQDWYDQKQDFVIVDARNEHEAKVGKFKDAIVMPIKTFREFPQASAQLISYKEKKIILYCTGGIRCEKASAYLKQQGFRDVYQLKGGIINYLTQYPHGYWEGGLFVFDDRLVAPAATPISTCSHCHTLCERYINCHNLQCDKLFICCTYCQEKMNYTCSEVCKNAPQQRLNINPFHLKKMVGIVQNYYPKVKVALVRVQEEPFPLKSKISIMGTTTVEFTQEIAEMKDFDGRSIGLAHPGQLITFPVDQKVRKNDKIIM